jgi:hypothetical protein
MSLCYSLHQHFPLQNSSAVPPKKQTGITAYAALPPFALSERIVSALSDAFVSLVLSLQLSRPCLAYLFPSPSIRFLFSSLRSLTVKTKNKVQGSAPEMSS